MKSVHLSLLLLCSFVVVAFCNSAINARANRPQMFYPLTEEKMRFAEKRCQELYPNQSINQTPVWDFTKYPKDFAEFCFVKCYLLKLGLINLLTRAIDVEVLTHFLKFDVKLPFPKTFESCFSLMKNVSDESCVSYYAEFRKLRFCCSDFFEAVFLKKRAGAEFGFYPPPSKAYKESAVRFCGAEPVQSFGNKKLRLKNLFVHDCRLVCVFNNFHYFDAYGRLDEKEIIRSYHEAKFNQPQTTNSIKSCVQKANALYDNTVKGACNMALALQNCLKERAPGYLKVYLKRNQLSEDF